MLLLLLLLLQSTNADLRNLLLLLDPESMRDGLRTAAKTKQITVNKAPIHSIHPSIHASLSLSVCRPVCLSTSNAMWFHLI
jgi:hypothetical protein